MFGSASGSNTIAALLGIAIVAQGFYTMKLLHEVETLSTQVEQSLGDAGRERASKPSSAEGATAKIVRPVILRPSSDSSGIDPEALHDSVRAVVAAELERAQWGKVERKSERSADHYAELGDSLTTQDGLHAEIAQRAEAVLVRARETREDLRRAEKNGELSTDEATAALAELRTSTQQQLRATLGEDWVARMDRAREDMRATRRKQRAERGPGGVFWFMPIDEHG